MKKIKFAGLLLLAPVMLLTACRSTATTLTFNANWYRDTALKDRVENTLEQLEYEVSFESGSGNNGWLTYTDGVYKTELRGDSQKHGYIYTTDLSMTVNFAVGGETVTFEDTVHTEVQFLTAAEGLKPTYSYREVHSHVPSSASPTALSNAYYDYSYTYSVEYDEELTKAKTVHRTLDTLKDAEGGYAVSEEIARDYNIKSNGTTFLDNEQIIFALRGLDLTAGGSFRSINAVTGVVQNVSLANVAAITTKVDFVADGKPVQSDSISAVSISIGYTGSNNGQPQHAVYAATTNPAANLYRNALLSLEVPLVYSTLGTLSYTLKTANFASVSN